MEKEERTAYSKSRSAEEFIEAEQVKRYTPQSSDRIDYALLKERIDIVDYISQHIKLKENRGKFTGKCSLPGHEDSTASFYIYPDTSSFYCFGCNRGGDVIKYAELKGVSARELMQEFG